MELKKTPADHWFSKCVRERSNWICEYCEIDLSNDKAKLDCSHFVSRGKLSTRYHPLNAMALCKSCHNELGGGRWGGGNVAEHCALYDEVFSEGDREVIRLLSWVQFRKHQMHLKDISAHYRSQHREMERIRKDGYIERLEFEIYLGNQELYDKEAEIRREVFE